VSWRILKNTEHSKQQLLLITTLDPWSSESWSAALGLTKLSLPSAFCVLLNVRDYALDRLSRYEAILWCTAP
jgi:hypothetical protein